MHETGEKSSPKEKFQVMQKLFGFKFGNVSPMLVLICGRIVIIEIVTKNLL